MRIAALDADVCRVEWVRKTIQAIGHECHGYVQAIDLMRDLKRQSFDMIVLDWNLPGHHAPAFMRWLRDDLNLRTPVLCIDARCSDQEMIFALTMGADDFVYRPIRESVLQARVRALLFRIYPVLHAAEQVFGPYRFFLHERQLHFRGEIVDLNHREFELAIFLFRNLGRVLSREHLVEAVWGASVEVTSRSIDTHMSRLRNKLDLRPTNGMMLSAIYGTGYRLEFTQSPLQAHNAGKTAPHKADPSCVEPSAS